MAFNVGLGYVPIKSPPAAPVGAEPDEAIVIVPLPFVIVIPVPEVRVALESVLPTEFPINN
ncbi:hypothetical protein D3C87_1185620 [compost metagenome]